MSAKTQQLIAGGLNLDHPGAERKPGGGYDAPIETWQYAALIAVLDELTAVRHSLQSLNSNLLRIDRRLRVNAPLRTKAKQPSKRKARP